MDHETLDSITRRYSPLDKLLRAVSSSVDAAGPAAKLQVSFGTGVADASFERLFCCTADGDASTLRSHDGKMEGRQMTFLLSYDRDHRCLGVHAWPCGSPGTPKDVLGKGAFGRKARDFALVTHREWFRAGELPVGVPAVEKAPAGIARAELEIFIFGRSGAPTMWPARRK